MANSTAPVYFKPTVAFNRGDTFVFGAWVCTTDGMGSFQRHLTMPPNPETGFVTLPEVVTGELADKFDEISLFNHHADFELGSASNSNSTSPWAIACEPAAQPSHVCEHKCLATTKRCQGSGKEGEEHLISDLEMTTTTARKVSLNLTTLFTCSIDGA
jgi:hypothetical protein